MIDDLESNMQTNNIESEFDNLDGDTLAVYQENCSQVSIFNIFINKKIRIRNKPK